MNDIIKETLIRIGDYYTGIMYYTDWRIYVKVEDFDKFINKEYDFNWVRVDKGFGYNFLKCDYKNGRIILNDKGNYKIFWGTLEDLEEKNYVKIKRYKTYYLIKIGGNNE